MSIKPFLLATGKGKLNYIGSDELSKNGPLMIPGWQSAPGYGGLLTLSGVTFGKGCSTGAEPAWRLPMVFVCCPQVKKLKCFHVFVLKPCIWCFLESRKKLKSKKAPIWTSGWSSSLSYYCWLAAFGCHLIMSDSFRACCCCFQQDITGGETTHQHDYFK